MKHLLTYFLLLSLPLAADIEIRRDQQGRITLKNRTPTAATLSTKQEPQAAPNPYHNLITVICNQVGFDPQLAIAVCRAESSFNPGAISKKGAVGLMQLMPDTARQYGVTDRTNPTQNLTAGIRHLKYLHNKYQSLPLTLAAYNAGEEPVRKYRGVPPFQETKQYVKRIMGFLGIPYGGDSRNKVFLYRQPNGRILLTDSPMPTNKGYKTLGNKQ